MEDAVDDLTEDALVEESWRELTRCFSGRGG